MGTFTFEECKLALEQLDKFKPFSISLIGGEVLLLDYIYDLIDLINTKGYVCNLATNGTLINEKVVERLKKYNIGYVQISIDGIQDTHDSIRGKDTYKKSVNAIKLLKEAGLKVHIDPLLCKVNKSEVTDLIKLGENLNVDMMKFNLFFPVGRGEEKKSDYELNEKEIKEVINNIRED